MPSDAPVGDIVLTKITLEDEVCFDIQVKLARNP
jgi:hypothetical protein